MGLDSCPMIGYDIDQVAKLIRLPDDHVMGPMIAIGRALQPAWPMSGQLPLEDIVRENGF